MEDAAKRASIFVTATGCCDVLRPEHFLEMRDDSILANIGHFDIEVDVAWLETNCKKVTIKPQVSHVHLNIITALLVSSTGRCVEEICGCSTHAKLDATVTCIDTIYIRTIFHGCYN